ncbi:MAG: acetyl-CoA hydrolase/transferase C-terminal domain-containing protein [Woeseiaceae bacterium]|jgi:acyl-CoA hydrolase|nr:acetyl-CoA hydrolase/transferase C-terminal domain-containing protein [Woeseiaceae bacterium]
MSDRTSIVYETAEQCVDRIIGRVGRELVVGAPLGLGKPVHLLNALFRRAVVDPTLRLRIVTGLSLARPHARSDIEKRFVEPIVDRVFGDYPDLDYVGPYMRNELPENIEVSEFFMRAGSFVNNEAAQRRYISSNYTHVGRDLMLQGVNVFVQAVAKRTENGETCYSLSSNSDSLDLFPLMRAAEAAGEPTAIVAQVNARLPFMPRDAAVPATTFDIVLDNRDLDHDLIGTPSGPVAIADYLIGLAASSLVKDGGTVQFGIGSLGDAIVYALCLRHEQNARYREILDTCGLSDRFRPLIDQIGGNDTFERGLYGATEMFADCYRHLYRSGILKREVYDDVTIQRLINEGKIEATVGPLTLDALLRAGAISSKPSAADTDYLVRSGVFRPGITWSDGELVTADGETIPADLGDIDARRRIEASCLGSRLDGGSILHAGFFMGPGALYDMLRGLDDSEAEKFNMTGICFVNQLYGHEELAILQRQHARFINTAMMMTLGGSACSDGLDNGQVISGVGGQYNFVAMAHALDGARSILMLRSTRSKGGNVSSNIVFNYGHTTIPRHLRDIVITEYGIADLRGRQDQECIKALLNITDSRFQDELLAKAVAAGKLEADYRIPDAFRDNTPARLAATLRPYRAEGLFPTFPFGTDLTREEQVLARILKTLKTRMGRRLGLAGIVKGVVGTGGGFPEAARPYLARLGLEQPRGLRESMLQRVIVAELRAGGVI